MTKSLMALVRSEVNRVVDAHHYSPNEVPLLLLTMREARTDDEMAALARAFLVRHKENQFPAYVRARESIEAALAAHRGEPKDDVDETLLLAERPYDTPCLDTTLHDIEMDVD